MAARTKDIRESIPGVRSATIVDQTLKGITDEAKDETRIEKIPVRDITLRPVNNYKIIDGDELRNSIVSLGQLDPIYVTRGIDLPLTNECVEAFFNQGIDYKNVKYMATTGNRRTAELLKLHEEELSDPNRKPGDTYKYEYVLAIVLTPEEAKNEEQIYRDSNNTQRPKDAFEIIANIRDLVTDFDTDEKKLAIMEKMGRSKRQGWSETAAVQYRLKKIGYGEIPIATIENHLKLLKNGCEEVVSAICHGEIVKTSVARNWMYCSPADQIKLMNAYKPYEAAEIRKKNLTDEQKGDKAYVKSLNEEIKELKTAYKSMLDNCPNAVIEPEKRIEEEKVRSYKDSRSACRRSINAVEVERKELEKCLQELGGKARASTERMIKLIEEFQLKMSEEMKSL